MAVSVVAALDRSTLSRCRRGVITNSYLNSRLPQSIKPLNSFRFFEFTVA